MATVSAAQRDKVAELIWYLYRHREQLDYPPGDERTELDRETWELSERQMRKRLDGGGRLQFDCSQEAQQVFRWAGLKDPCGLEYAYAGDTGAMLRTLPHYFDPREAYVAALVVFGPGRGEHVSTVIGRGRDPLLASHGRPGFDLWHLSQQRTWHHPPVTFCSIAHLG